MKKFEPNIFEQGRSLFTQDEFNSALTEAKAEIMAIAIESTKQAISIEREECAKIAHFMQLNDARAAGVDVGKVQTFGHGESPDIASIRIVT